MQKYIHYANHVNAAQDVQDWINIHLTAHLKSNSEDQSEIEHILDYMASDKRPARLTRMSYAQAKTNTEKWLKAQIKKGNDIKEFPEDTEIVKDFGDGFKIVRLVGKALSQKLQSFWM